MERVQSVPLKNLYIIKHRENSKNIVLELRKFVLKNRVSTYILVSMFSILERNGEMRKVKLSLFNNF